MEHTIKLTDDQLDILLNALSAEESKSLRGYRQETSEAMKALLAKHAKLCRAVAECIVSQVDKE